MRLGTPLPKTRAKPPTSEEIEVVVRNWRQNSTANYRNLLIALSVELIESEESDWYWSQAERVYTNKNSDTVSASKAGVLLTALLVGRNLSDAKTAGLMGYGQLAEGLKNGSLTLADWTDGMRNLVRLSQETGILVANGGVEFVTQSDWSYMVTQIEKQYEYLDKFAADIAKDPEKWLNGRLDNRMRLYQESAYSAYQNDLRREAKIGGMDEERRVIGVADHCFIAGTQIETPSGSKPIELLKIGDLVTTRYGTKKVTQTFCNDYYGDLYQISSKDKKVVTTANHPFYTDNGWKRADELKDSDNIMLFENGRYGFNSNVSFPYSLNKIPASSQVFISRGVSCPLFYLSLYKRFKTRVSMPVFPIGLDNKLSNTNIDNKIRLDHYGVFKTYPKIINDFVQFLFKSRRFILLEFSSAKHKFFNNIRSGKSSFSKSVTCPGKFGRIVFSHILSGLTVYNFFCRFFGKQYVKSVYSVKNFFMGNIKFFSAPRRAVNRIVVNQKVNPFFSPIKSTFKFVVTSLAKIRVPIFFITTLTAKSSLWGKRFASAFFTYITYSLSFLATQLTSPYRRTLLSSCATRDTSFNISLSDVSTDRTSSFDRKFFVEKFRHSLLLPNNDKLHLIIPHSTKVYNIEVDGAHEYIANGFVVHNCDDCLDYAAMGWQPIGTLPEIGDSRCSQNCHCEFEYRKAENGE